MVCLLLFQGVPWAGIWWLESIIFYALIVLALVVMLNIFLKYRNFRHIKRSSRQYAPRVAQALLNLNIDEAVEISKNFAKSSHLAKTVDIGLDHYINAKGAHLKEMSFKHAKEEMERHANYLKYELESGVGFLDAVGRTSPFIGALGGSAVTFAMGILIAIPAVWFATYERNKASEIVTEIKNGASELMAFLEKKLQSK